MLIESIIKRVRYPLRPDGSGRDTVVGTTITLGKVMYRFHPQPKLTPGDDAHVCEVKNPDHIETLLNIPEGFCQYGYAPREKREEPRIAPGQLPIKDEIVPDDEPVPADALPPEPED